MSRTARTLGNRHECAYGDGPRTYEIRTYGCQMNVHDSERLSGLLESAGYVRAEDAEPDVVVFNTCAVRENADNRLYGNLGHLRPVKDGHPGMQIAVGGCLAQKDRDTIVKRAPWVDVVFGTHNIGSLPALLERARVRSEAQVEIEESLVTFLDAADAPGVAVRGVGVDLRRLQQHVHVLHRPVPARQGEGPPPRRDPRRGRGARLRGRPRGHPPGAERQRLRGGLRRSRRRARRGARHDGGRAVGLRRAAARLRRCRGLERVRFTSPHPKDFTDDVIAAMAETPNVMPSLHMPLQSGSDAVLRAMRRSYRQERYLGIIGKVREAIPDAAITTDIIVGFPGETEADFEETLHVVREARFASAFTFQYSKRPGTPAATMDGQLPKEVVQERYERLIALQEEISWAENRKQLGRTLEVLVAEGEGRKDEATRRLSGRASDNRLVHFGAPDRPVRPGDMVTVEVTYAAPHHLVADKPVLDVRRTRAGDAWEARQEQGGQKGVSLGMPSIGRRPRPRRPCRAARPVPDSGMIGSVPVTGPSSRRQRARSGGGVPASAHHRPGDGGEAAPELDALRAACDRAVRSLSGCDALIVVGGGTETRAYGPDAYATLRPYGLDWTSPGRPRTAPRRCRSPHHRALAAVAAGRRGGRALPGGGVRRPATGVPDPRGRTRRVGRACRSPRDGRRVGGPLGEGARVPRRARAPA